MSTAAYVVDSGPARLRTILTIIRPLILLTVATSIASAIIIALYLNDMWTWWDLIYEDLSLFDLIIYGDLLVFLASALGVTFWLYSAHTNLLAVGTPGAVTRPGWAIAWYAIPIANLFKPFLSMKELWQGSIDQHIDNSETAPGLMWVWWMSWLAASLSGFGEDYNALDVAAYLAAAVSAVSLFMILEKITAAQPTMSVASTFE